MSKIVSSLYKQNTNIAGTPPSMTWSEQYPRCQELPFPFACSVVAGSLLAEA